MNTTNPHICYKITYIIKEIIPIVPVLKVCHNVKLTLPRLHLSVLDLSGTYELEY